MRTVVVSLIAEDRPGLVAQLAAAVAEQGGNWLESQMGRLGGTFAGAVLVEIAPEHIDDLTRAVRDLRDVDVVEVTAATDGGSADADLTPVHLLVVGQDQPGIGREVTVALADRGLGIREFHSATSDAPMSGERLFEAAAVIGVAPDLDLSELRAALDEVSTQLRLDIRLDEGDDNPAWGEVPDHG
jgi:glycine cleavage system regulatory protein